MFSNLSLCKIFPSAVFDLSLTFRSLLTTKSFQRYQKGWKRVTTDKVENIHVILVLIGDNFRHDFRNLFKKTYRVSLRLKSVLSKNSQQGNFCLLGTQKESRKIFLENCFKDGTISISSLKQLHDWIQSEMKRLENYRQEKSHTQFYSSINTSFFAFLPQFLYKSSHLLAL